jgi:AraC-like DNA-binding protein
MPEFTIAASAGRALMEFAVSKGGNRTVLAERSRIDPAELQDGDNRLKFAKYVALMRAGQDLCKDPALALHFGESIDVAEVSFACTIGAFSETMAEGFALTNRYARLAVEVECSGNGDRFQMARIGGQMWIVDARTNPNDFPELTESTFARGVCSSRGSFREFVKAVHVTHPAPAYRAEYDRIFRVPVTFGSDRNALLTDDRLFAQLSSRSPSASRSVSEVLKAHADALMERLESSKSTRDCVESLLMSLLPSGEAGMDTIALRMGLSRQTLFRRLKADGVTFEHVLDELRQKMALQYLGGQKVSVNRTASLVGFSEPAAFSRAFKRWTGSSPRVYASRCGSSA